MISCARISPEDWEDVLAFQVRAFGKEAYQAQEGYLCWLYQENPFAPSELAGWVARDTQADGGVVGVIHTMHLPAVGPGGAMSVHSLQNLYVAEHQRGGLGMLLVKRALKGADITLFPGVAPDLANIYQAIRYHEIDTFWGRKLLRPVGIGVGMGLGKLGIVRSAPHAALLGVTPSQTLIEVLCDRLRRQAQSATQIYVAWTPELVRWRFFSDNGPRHALFIDPDTPQAFCLASVGMRHNVQVMRLIEYGDDRAFLADAMARLRRAGCELALCYAARPGAREMVQALGFGPVAPQPTSFVKARGGGAPDILTTPGMTDLGFESLMQRRTP